MNADSHAYNTYSPESTKVFLKLYVNPQLKPLTSISFSLCFQALAANPTKVQSLHASSPPPLTSSNRQHQVVPATTTCLHLILSYTYSSISLLWSSSAYSLWQTDVSAWGKSVSISSWLKHQFLTSTPSFTCHGHPCSPNTAFVNKRPPQCCLM